jgi:hypothetical protein
MDSRGYRRSDRGHIPGNTGEYRGIDIVYRHWLRKGSVVRQQGSVGRDTTVGSDVELAGVGRPGKEAGKAYGRV